LTELQYDEIELRVDIEHQKFEILLYLITSCYFELQHLII